MGCPRVIIPEWSSVRPVNRGFTLKVLDLLDEEDCIHLLLALCTLRRLCMADAYFHESECEFGHPDA